MWRTHKNRRRLCQPPWSFHCQLVSDVCLCVCLCLQFWYVCAGESSAFHSVEWCGGTQHKTPRQMKQWGREPKEQRYACIITLHMYVWNAKSNSAIFAKLKNQKNRGLSISNRNFHIRRARVSLPLTPWLPFPVLFEFAHFLNRCCLENAFVPQD